MSKVTLDIPDHLAHELKPANRWISAILEVGLARFKTQASATAAELVEFFLSDPSPTDMLDYHVSEQAQRRLQILLTLNQAGILPASEQRELDELEHLEEIVIRLKQHAYRESYNV